MLRETALGPCKIISSMLRGPALGPCKTSGSMFGGYCWAHARPSVVCCGGSTGPIQKFIFSALNSIWAHSRHLQNICTLGPQWAHVGFHKHDGTFADGLSHYHRDFLVSLCAPWAVKALKVSHFSNSGPRAGVCRCMQECADAHGKVWTVWKSAEECRAMCNCTTIR